MDFFISAVPPAFAAALVVATVCLAASLALLATMKIRGDREESASAQRADGLREPLTAGDFDIVARALVQGGSGAVRSLHSLFVEHPGERDAWATGLASQSHLDTVLTAVISTAETAQASNDHGTQRICDELIRFLSTASESHTVLGVFEYE